MGRFSRRELEWAVAHYAAVLDECSRTEDWTHFADLFTEDVVYIEHAWGTFRGREEVRAWSVASTAPFPHIRLTHDWVAYDEPNDAIVLGVNNILDHPSEPGLEFSFPCISRLVYAGDGLFSVQEDVYNPDRDAMRAVQNWVAAGGQLRAEPRPSG
jgi:hypothetical protein